jgi:hypothetical protein
VDKNESRAKQIYLEGSEKQRRMLAPKSWLVINRELLDEKVRATMRGSGIDWEDILAKRGSVVGSVERAIDTLHAYAEAGIDMTVFNVLPGITGTAEVERNMRVLAQYVLPEFRHGVAPTTPDQISGPHGANNH